jgi:hypothetical protein
MGDVPQYTVKECYYAGFCLCGRQGVPLRSFVTEVQRLLGQWLTKGSAARRFYDRSALVVEISFDGGELFFHIGYGNLNNHRFTLLTLKRPETRSEAVEVAERSGRTCLVVRDPEDLSDFGVNLWKAFRGLDFGKHYTAVLWRLVGDDDAVVDFLPSELEVVKMGGDFSLEFYKGRPGPGPPGGGRRPSSARNGSAALDPPPLSDIGPTKIPDGNRDAGGGDPDGDRNLDAPAVPWEDVDEVLVSGSGPGDGFLDDGGLVSDTEDREQESGCDSGMDPWGIHEDSSDGGEDIAPEAEVGPCRAAIRAVLKDNHSSKCYTRSRTVRGFPHKADFSCKPV